MHARLYVSVAWGWVMLASRTCDIHGHFQRILMFLAQQCFNGATLKMLGGVHGGPGEMVFSDKLGPNV